MHAALSTLKNRSKFGKKLATCVQVSTHYLRPLPQSETRLLITRSITHLGFRRPRYNITKKMNFFVKFQLFTHFNLNKANRLTNQNFRLCRHSAVRMQAQCSQTKQINNFRIQNYLKSPFSLCENGLHSALIWIIIILIIIIIE